MLPRIAITMGDPAGIGPEVIAGCWPHQTLHSLGHLVVLGNPNVLRRAVALTDAPIEVCEVGAVDERASSVSLLPCLPCVDADAELVSPATVDSRGGRAAYDALAVATELAFTGQVDALTTAPLNKAALAAAGIASPGHTELLANFCGLDESAVAMMLYLDGAAGGGPAGLGVAHVTLHVALRDVFRQLETERIVRVAHLASNMMATMLSHATPRIGVCALNPHGGEQQLFGDEEMTIIQPAVEAAAAEGLNISGPWPADTLLASAASGQYDAVVAMYHDQGHIALKLLNRYRAVNVTLGLPIVRTSVAHGTAFDLAWQGRARTDGMISAIRTAARLVARRSAAESLASVS